MTDTKHFNYSFWLSAKEDKELEDAIKILEDYSNMRVVRSDFFRKAIFHYIHHEVSKISPTKKKEATKK